MDRSSAVCEHHHRRVQRDSGERDPVDHRIQPDIVSGDNGRGERPNASDRVDGGALCVERARDGRERESGNRDDEPLLNVLATLFEACDIANSSASGVQAQP